MPPALISYLTDVHFGAGAVGELPAILQQLNCSRPLCVSDQGLIGLGFPDRLGVTLAGVFGDVPTNPTEDSVDQGVACYRENDCDCVIALGGGSPMDAGKAVSLKVTHTQPLREYALIHGGLSRITNSKPPVIAIPTTAGTGSEVGRAALITVKDGTKLGIISKHMIPDVSICDPELTLGLPPRLTAATGVDAISHCVETYCSPKFNPVADSIALDGLRRAWSCLPSVVQAPHDIALRSEMMMAAMQGALAFQKGLGLIHSLSHPMGGLTSKPLHHGELNGVFMPHVLRFNQSSCGEKMHELGASIGSSHDQVAQAFSHLLDQLGLPQTLSQMGVETSDLEGIAELAMQDHSTPSNPRTPTLDDCQRLLQVAF